MRQSLALGMGLFAACATTHSLGPPSQLSTEQKACRIGVGRFADEQGVDHALDLRDYLRAKGPCSTVVAVVSDQADVDLVVTGTVRSELNPDLNPPWQSLGATGTGVGIGVGASGGLALLLTEKPSPDEDGFIDPGDKAQFDFLRQTGTVFLTAGALATVASIAWLIVDETAVRETKLDATVEASVVISRKGTVLDQRALSDRVTVYGKHPPGRPEGRGEFAAHGPLYREVMAHVFQHVAETLGAQTVLAGEKR